MSAKIIPLRRKRVLRALEFPPIDPSLVEMAAEDTIAELTETMCELADHYDEDKPGLGARFLHRFSTALLGRALARKKRK